MEFTNGPKRKRFYPDQDNPGSSSWSQEDDEWARLLGEVEKEAQQKRRRSIFPRRKESSFDAPKELKKPNQKVEISLKLTLPKTKLKLPEKVRNFRPERRYVIISLILVVVIGVVGTTILSHNRYRGAQVAGANSSNDPGSNGNKDLPREKPAFKILYPAGKSAESFGEPVKVSPPNNDPVYAYTDRLSGVDIILSQQKVPASFEGNTSGQLEKVAKDFQATDSFAVDSVTVYYGKTTTGIQSLVFIKGNLLVFIKSPNVLSQEVWAAYISALHD